MTISKSILTALALAAIVPAWGQDTFDLQSQRKEVQNYLAVPGEKLDHKGIIINPTPHSLETNGAGTLGIADGFKLKGDQRYEADLLKASIPTSWKGTLLTIATGAKAAKKQKVEAKEGAYRLTVDKNGVTITGYDDKGAFYGIQTLRQLVESPIASNGTLPYLTIADYPDLPHRGVVEGFYGTPWSHEVRLSLIDFYGRNKMNDYLYGPKDDPYHSSPYWRQPYPEQEAKQIHELVEACKANRVNFVWAIHPGKDIRWDKADYDSLVSKLDMMYDLGVRSFALFFDDIEGIGTDSNRQAELVNDLTRDFVEKKGDVTNLMICPTDYSQLWAKPGPKGQLAIYGEKLNPKAEVFWTGAVVCSDLTPETLEFIDSRIKRPALYWWNYPVTDYARNYLLQGPVYGLDTSLTSAQTSGIESNPMEHGEASKLALYGVADYAWNVSSYNPIDNWERGLSELAPDQAEAYRLFAIHSADTETGYRRDESWETTTFPFDNYTPAQFEALKKEFEAIRQVEGKMDKISNKALLKELKPWLTQFTRLGERGARTLDLIKIFESGDDTAFWNNYLANLMTDEEKAAYTAHKSGTMKLQPFYQNAMDGMLEAFYKKASGEVPSMYKGTGSYRSLGSVQAKAMLDNDSTTYYHSGNAQRAGHWAGLDLGAVRKVEEINILQGRNSVDDVDYFDNVILEASADGKDWKALTDSMQRTYHIHWTGAPVDARYVRIRKLHSPKSNWLAIRTFDVNPLTPERLGNNLTAPDDKAVRAFDSNPATEYAVKGEIAFDRKPDTKSLTLLLGTPGTGCTLVELDGKGNTIRTTPISSQLVKTALDEATTRVKLLGPCTVYEIIADK